jgi:hypothetical protein
MNIIRNTGKLIFVLSVSILSVQNGYSQEDQAKPVSAENEPVTNYYYRQFTGGINIPTYRDFATSPLFYSGVGLQVQTAWIKRSDLRERSFDVSFGYNAMSARVPRNDYIQPAAGSTLLQLNLRYIRMWKLNALSSEKNNIKVGFVVHVTQDFRSNPSLLNNAYGFENITNMMASGQITRDISRKEARKINLLLFKPTLKPVKRDLRFQFNAGIFNFNYRPGYAYSYVGEIEGTETSSMSDILGDYTWSLNGWRVNTQLEYITYLPNGNARSWSYVWDAANAPGSYEAFQMASHQIRYTYYFQTKKR